MTIRRKVLTAIRWTVIARLTGQVFTWAATLFVIRILNPSDYGLMAMSMVLTSLLFLINNIGLESVLVQRRDLDQESRERIFGLVILTNLTCFALMLISARPLAEFFGEPDLVVLIRALSIQFLILIFESLPLSALERELRFRRRSIVDLISMIAASVITLVLALLGMGVWALIYGHLGAMALRIIGLNLIARCLCRPRFSFAGMKEIVGFGGFVSVDRFLWFVFAESDKFIGGKLLGKELLGFYSVANHLGSLPINKVAGLVSSVAFPAFSKIQKDTESVRAYLHKAVRLMSMFAFPIFFGISSVAPTAVMLFLGEKWAGAIFPLQVLALVMPLRMINTIIPPVLWGIGKPRVSAENFLISALCMMPAFIVGAHFGPVGLALSWAAAYPLVFFITAYRGGRAIGVRALELIGELVRPLIAAGGMYAAVIIVKPLMQGTVGSIPFLLQQVLVGVIAYALVLLVVNKQGIVEAVDLLTGESGSERSVRP